jgi:hypothetical protein
MKFSTKEDIEAPIADTFALFTEFDHFERSALRRGADVRRTDSMRTTGVGMAWASGFKLRGRTRNVNAEMVEFVPNENYTIELQSNDIAALAVVDLLALSKSRTRASISVELKPKSLSGRLMVQTMRLAKTRLVKRFKMKVSGFVLNVERQYKTGART